MGYITAPFHLFFKRLGPTGSEASPVYRGNLTEFWFESASASPRVSGAFLNFPDDTSTLKYATTISPSNNNKFKALPWGSMACDMLWNVTVPSWSFDDITKAAGTVNREWSVSLIESKSFFRNNFPSGTDLGVATYGVTSSWKIVDSKLLSPGTFDYCISASFVPTFPTFVGSRATIAAAESSSLIAYDVTYPTLGANSTSSFDGRYFDKTGGAGITRADISRSLVTQSIYQDVGGGTAVTALTKALKARRLYFPIPFSNSGASTGTDYWFKKVTGYRADELFNENGGIYNIQLTLKKFAEADYYPDNNTFLSVFIHDVKAAVYSNVAKRAAGFEGWYPPDGNIVKIGNAYNGGPTLAFNDPQTGYRIEKFNFNVIQYGYPAQLCIEASGSLNDNAYFGIIVDDIQICKIGVTTDPRFIKPISIATQTGFNSTQNPNDFQPEA